MADNASRDENRVTTLMAVSSADNVTPVNLWADPDTHALLVEGGGGAAAGGSLQTDQFMNLTGNSNIENAALCTLVSCDQGGAIDRIATWIGSTTGSPVLELGIYDYDLNLLGAGTNSTLVDGEMNEVTIPEVTLVAGQLYYLAWLQQEAMATAEFSAGSAIASNNIVGFSATPLTELPDPIVRGSATATAVLMVAYKAA